MTESLKSLFHFHLRRPSGQPYGAAPLSRTQWALWKAKADLAAGTRRYGEAQGWKASGPWNPLHNGTRFLETETDSGLRFVGLSSDLLKGSRRDVGAWYCDSFQHSTLAGAVFRLPAKGKRCRYLIGYQESDSGAFVLDMETGALQGDAGITSHWDDDDSLRDAAIRADSLAEHAAEKAREYDSAWQAGSRWNDERETAAAARREALAILQERRKVPPIAAPALCAAIRSQVESLLSDIRVARKAMASLANGAGYPGRDSWELAFYPSAELKGAFNDGAGQTVLA